MDGRTTYRLLNGKGSYIGGFELSYDVPSSYEYKAFTSITGYFINRASWK